MAKRPYLDDLQTARLWAKVKALVSPLSSRVTTLEGQVQTNTTDLSGLATRVRTLELKYDTNVTGNSGRGFHQPLRRGGHWCVE